ncbi:MAG: Coenzyme F420 hydrogenase/dehydrogenase, beta subunit C-terminal domain [Candidatus Helarchaeota archaeon]|nr:Coenzyme F420 hydrogenase/dehydrogenase, beta subunit C-terminal domain [Candidatus Helarchaeota archaeon]
MVEISNTKESEELPKSFEDLIQEVHNLGICGQCAGCVSFCSADQIGAIQMIGDGPPTYTNKENCLHCGICYLICPQIKVLDSELHQAYEYKPPIGHWNYVTSAQATSHEIRTVATDGGVVTALLLYLLENKMIDGAIVTKRTDPFTREAFLATTRDELISAAGSKFDSQALTEHLGKYTTFTPVVTSLKDFMDTDYMNLAVVGVPCQIHSIRKMQELKIVPAHVVKYTFGLFCNENFSFTQEIRQKMEEKFNFSFDDIIKMNIKEDVIFHLRNAEPLHISFSDIDEFMRPACTACDDFSNIYADISFGGLGSKDNFTTSLVRNSLGAEIYHKALVNGYIVEFPEDNTPVMKSKMIAKIISFAKWKLKRAEKTLAELGKKGKGG